MNAGRGSRRNRWAGCVLGLLLLGACEEGGTEVEPLLGRYELWAYYGQPLPYLIPISFRAPPGVPRYELIAGYLELSSGGRYLISTTTRRVDTGETVIETEPGTWRLSGNRMVLDQDVDPIGTVLGDVIEINYHGAEYVFRR